VGGGGGLSLLPFPYSYLTNTAAAKFMHIKLTENSTEYRILNLMYIKLPMYLFYYMALGLNNFDAGKSPTRVIGRGGSWKSPIF
jgi:hypothetical protein